MVSCLINRRNLLSYHAQLGLPDKGCTINGLIVSWVLHNLVHVILLLPIKSRQCPWFGGAKSREVRAPKKLLYEILLFYWLLVFSFMYRDEIQLEYVNEHFWYYLINLAWVWLTAVLLLINPNEWNLTAMRRGEFKPSHLCDAVSRL